MKILGMVIFKRFFSGEFRSDMEFLATPGATGLENNPLLGVCYHLWLYRHGISGNHQCRAGNPDIATV